MGYEIWKTIDQVDTQKYLYHYTSMENAYKILYSKVLRFSNLCSTNDIFEQRPKLIFEDLSNTENISKAKEIKKYLSTHRKKIKILCLSTDQFNQSDYDIMCETLTFDQIRANVTGRGFALPRMWAQYASNSTGVCLVINKQKLFDTIKKQSIDITFGYVQYLNSHSTHLITNSSLNKMYNLIKSNNHNTLQAIISCNSGFVEHNFFYKLSDWKDEREFRIITTAENKEDIIEINDTTSFIEGIVIGHNVDNLHEILIQPLISNNCDLRRIVFEDTITKIIKNNRIL